MPRSSYAGAEITPRSTSPAAVAPMIAGAEPRIEAPLPGANDPYTVLGRRYVPLNGDASFRQRGIASWYAEKFHGRKTASGELYDMNKMTAAHPTLPIPSYARVRNVGNNREVIVRINDRGPFHSDRIVDLSYGAARHLGILGAGNATVEIERLTNEAIRTGSWRPGASGQAEPIAASYPVATSTAPLQSQPMQFPDTRTSGTIPSAGRTVPTTATGAKPAPGFWLQLGAFRLRDGVERFQRQVSPQLVSLAPQLTIVTDDLFRLQAGPYPSRREAAAAAEQVRGVLQLMPMIVQHR